MNPTLPGIHTICSLAHVCQNFIRQLQHIVYLDESLLLSVIQQFWGFVVVGKSVGIVARLLHPSKPARTLEIFL